MPSTQHQILSNFAALELDNPSAAAMFNMIAIAVGKPIDNTVTEISNSENSIRNIISLQRYGKDDYYTKVAKAFQLGDDLVQDPVTKDNVYAVIDPTKQIVKQAAFIDDGAGSLFLKIAKQDPLTGLLLPLDNDEFAAFSAYFGVFEIPGLPVELINLPANILSFSAIATFYKTYNQTTLQTNLGTAMDTFRATFAFNGQFFDGDLESYIKTNVPGMRDFYVYNTTIDGAGFSGSKELDSGYFNYISNIQNAITYTPY